MVKGATREDRARARAERTEERRAAHVRALITSATNGRELVVAVCNLALAARKRITEEAQRAMAREIGAVVERYDVPANRKETTQR